MLEEFTSLLDRCEFSFLASEASVAVAVSGGSDSMALGVFMAEWAEQRGIRIHILSVDHGLREEAKDEAIAVGKFFSRYDHVTHQVLTWDVPKGTRIQEQARKARYDLMAVYCQEHGIETLFLGHHQDDQAETFLFRLAKGSGLDGLCGMRFVSEFDNRLKLCRPFLNVPKKRLVEFCHDREIPYFKDPSNQNDKFARVRLRAARDILEEEGLNSKRLALTAERLSRARDSIDEVVVKAYKIALNEKNTKLIVFNFFELNSWPQEIVLRVILSAIDDLGSGSDYGPRMEKVEVLVNELRSSDVFRKRTLGGVIFERDEEHNEIILSKEDA